MSRKRPGDHVPVAAQQHDAAQPAGDRPDQVVEGGALRQPAGDPHHRVVAEQRGLGGVRVGGLGVVDPGHAVVLGDQRDPVTVGPEAPQPVADGDLADAVRAGQGGGGQRVLHGVRRRPAGAGRGEVGQRAQLGGAGLARLDEGTVGEDVLDDAEHADGGHAEREADGPGALDDVGLADQRLGRRVGDVVDAGALDALVDPALVGGVVGHRRRTSRGGPRRR